MPKRALLIASLCWCWTAALLTAPPVGSAADSNPVTEAQSVQVKAAWIRWLPGGVPLAGYATLANESDRPSVLISVTSPAFRDLSLHQTVQTGGTVRMSPLERIAIPPHSTLDFEARGIHLMLMQPHAPLDPHGEVPMTLHFLDGSSLTVQFQVRASVGLAPGS
jgi:copper(I)-binding protein